jgi:hypothetical protein
MATDRSAVNKRLTQQTLVQREVYIARQQWDWWSYSVGVMRHGIATVEGKKHIKIINIP